VSGAHESLDDPEITKSGGIAPSMILFLGLSLAVIFMQAAFVISASGYWKAWPASDSVKVTLPSPIP
jgi:hypothetical protein